MIYRITGSDNLLVQKVMRNTLTRMGFRETGILFREVGLSPTYLKTYPHLTVDMDDWTISGRREIDENRRTFVQALDEISSHRKGKR